VEIQRKTARLTVLLDPSRKQAFERACHENDMTPSQVLRHLIRDYIGMQRPALPEAVRPIGVKPARNAASAPVPAAQPARRSAAKR
jgi:hypothetical protein